MPRVTGIIWPDLSKRIQKMDVKQAVQSAKEYLGELFSGETITHVGLEEVVFDDTSNCWKITVGFFRPWDRNGEELNPLLTQLRDRHVRRTYKIVQIDDDSGQALSLTNRHPVTSG